MTTNKIPKAKRSFPTEGDTQTIVSLTESEVSDDTVADALVAGQSPRVRYGGEFRKNGIPPKIEMSWEKWIGKPDKVQRPMTREEMVEHAKVNATDLEFRKQMLAALGITETQPNDKKPK